MVNGREYQVFTIKKQALFATATGKLKIPSSTFAVSAGTGGDLFGIFGRTQTLYRKTDELFLDVKPLPVAGRPADFRNAVGSFNLTAGIDKTQAATGEAVALRVRLEGKGNLKMIPDISMPAIPDFTVYSSKRADSIRVLARQPDRRRQDLGIRHCAQGSGPANHSFALLLFLQCGTKCLRDRLHASLEPECGARRGQCGLCFHAFGKR